MLSASPTNSAPCPLPLSPQSVFGERQSVGVHGTCPLSRPCQSGTAARRRLPAVCYLPSTACCCPVACRLLPAACCLLPAVYCLLPAACCLPAAAACCRCSAAGDAAPAPLHTVQASMAPSPWAGSQLLATAADALAVVPKPYQPITEAHLTRLAADVTTFLPRPPPPPPPPPAQASSVKGQVCAVWGRRGGTQLGSMRVVAESARTVSRDS